MSEQQPVQDDQPECEHCHRRFAAKWQKQAHQMSYMAAGNRLCPTVKER